MTGRQEKSLSLAGSCNMIPLPSSPWSGHYTHCASLAFFSHPVPVIVFYLSSNLSFSYFITLLPSFLSLSLSLSLSLPIYVSVPLALRHTFSHVHSLFSFPSFSSRFSFLTFLRPLIWYLSAFRSSFLCLFLVYSFDSFFFTASSDCFRPLIYHCFSFFCTSIIYIYIYIYILCFHFHSTQCCLLLYCTASCNFRPEA